MKSKRLAALAMAAVVSVSALGVYATGNGDAGLTAFASVTYSDGSSKAVSTPQRYVTITMTQQEILDEFNKNHVYGCYSYDSDGDGTESGNTPVEWRQKSSSNTSSWMQQESCHGQINYDLTGKYLIPFWYIAGELGLNIDKMKSGGYKVYGWCVDTSESSGISVDAHTNRQTTSETGINVDSDDEAISHTLENGDGFLYSGSGSVKIVLRPVYKGLSDKEVLDNYLAEQEEAAQKKENDERYNHCAGRAWSNSAGNNVVNTGGHVASAFTTISTSSTNGVYTDAQIKSIKKAVGIDEDSNIISFVYEVQPYTVDQNFVSLIPGKNLMARLQLPAEYKTTGCSVAVFYVPHSGVKEVTNLDIGKKDVMFFTQNMGPYVLVLSPGQPKYENPPTADASSLPVVLLAAASLSAAGSLLMRRRELGE